MASPSCSSPRGMHAFHPGCFSILSLKADRLINDATGNGVFNTQPTGEAPALVQALELAKE